MIIGSIFIFLPHKIFICYSSILKEKGAIAMKALETLLLGEELKQSDKATFPSSPFRKIPCLRNHCTDKCLKNELIYGLLYKNTIDTKVFPIPDETKMYVYLKHSLNIPLNENVKKDDNDNLLIKSIFSVCNGNLKERDIFLVVKNLRLYFDLKDEFIKLINDLICLPSSNRENVFIILYHLFIDLEYSAVQKEFIDLINLSHFTDVLDVIFVYNLKSSDLFSFLKENNSLVKLREYASNHQSKTKDEIIIKEVDYFDCLVIQNEILNSFDKKKEEYEKKIKMLEKINEDLLMSNANLKEYILNLEINLKEYKEKYVDDLKKMIRNKK
ncbi:hypothetical protein H311_00292 [Anncaliia algerae PRA109]|nr:hypothetical protein H311_00292 [Anncaliia algerae PRA109]